jgi:predicted amidohydrolase
MATARVNRMAIACADRLGTERGLEWTGGSSIVGADGWVAAETRAIGMAIADVDLDLALDKQLTELAHAFDDRRPEMYGSLAAAEIRG